ncbi:Dyp-type peroxidase [Elizabethkingia ursingii]|uniref:Peroxidase n=1 Tax=Elizabethkingia ursingii TaxID=1756150 RepID=A0AAJ3NFF4_9FLAO|nr:Dyp-type peroxidase [Elizabethkingia ursingii]AQX07575.1 peroxidase [Elizabethkingia ursingii]OPB79575.1 peroxidase [Elizabethkingia ursingii]
MAVQSQKVTDNPNANTVFTVWTFKNTDNIKEAFQRVCALVANLNNSAAVRFPNVRVSCVMGIGYNAWKKLELQEPLPKELEVFKEVKGEKHTAVTTSGDLHFHIRADQFSICFDMATAISDVLSPVADCIEEVHGFRYWDGRSIIGFVDGTENPQGADRDFFAKVGEEDEEYEGGSYLFVQKYVHDMTAWNSLPVPEQEKVIGRYKASDIEMTDDVKPVNSHSAVSNVGDDFKVVRDNMPFRTSSETGTYFIAYASTFSTVQKMLKSMFIGDPVGNYDRILDFSTAKTGSLFFVPTMDMLDDFSG